MTKKAYRTAKRIHVKDRNRVSSSMEAVREAAVSRFRPILMTSLTTILGILPLALATGAGAESRVSMGVTVVGGLFFATFLTLFVVPAIYSYLAAKKNIENKVNEKPKA